MALSSQELYKKLSGTIYSQYPYKKNDQGEGMWIVEQAIGEYWKPRYLVDEINKTAVEFMSSECVLQTVTVDDIDWKSLKGLPQEAISKAKALNAVFPTSVRQYKKSIASVDWELNPDGRYFMDEDGYGMTNDEEITVYSYVDRAGKPLVKFRYIKDFSELREMEKEALSRL